MRTARQYWKKKPAAAAHQFEDAPRDAQRSAAAPVSGSTSRVVFWSCGLVVLWSCGLVVLGSAAPPKPIAPTNAPAVEAPPPHSVFTIPSDRKEGVDPFFPNSTRLFVHAGPAPARRATFDLSTLVLQGIEPRKSVIIGGKTFYAGDEADVKDSTGTRIHIKCIEVREDSAIVEAGGEKRELRLRQGVF